MGSLIYWFYKNCSQYNPPISRDSSNVRVYSYLPFNQVYRRNNTKTAQQRWWQSFQFTFIFSFFGIQQNGATTFEDRKYKIKISYPKRNVSSTVNRKCYSSFRCIFPLEQNCLHINFLLVTHVVFVFHFVFMVFHISEHNKQKIKKKNHYLIGIKI